VLLGDAGNKQVIMPSNKSISYQRIDFLDIMDSHRGYQSLWSTCWELLKYTGTLTNILEIPQHEISVTDVLTSDQQGSPMFAMRQGLSFSSFSFHAKDDLVTVPVLPVGMDQYKLKHDRTYMVAGGVRGFGFEVARWMACNGNMILIILIYRTFTFYDIFSCASHFDILDFYYNIRVFWLCRAILIN